MAGWMERRPLRGKVRDDPADRSQGRANRSLALGARVGAVRLRAPAPVGGAARALELVRVAVQVGGRVGRELDRLAHVDEVLGLVGQLDGVLGPDLGARDVDPAAVHLDMAVADELAGLPLGQREPEAQDHGVQAGLELAEQLLARDPGLSVGPVVVAAHLPLADPVDVAELLLLEQPDLVLGEALAPVPVLARWIGALDGRAIGAPTQRLPSPTT